MKPIQSATLDAIGIGAISLAMTLVQTDIKASLILFTMGLTTVLVKYHYRKK